MRSIVDWHGWCKRSILLTSDSAIVTFMCLANNPRSTKMSGLRFVGACMAAALLTLSSQESMAQGVLATEPQSFESLMAPHPLGSPQKFGDWSSGSELRFTPAEPVSPRQRQARARDG